MPSNVRFSNSSGVALVGCVFSSLGAGALQFTGGGQDHLVSGCSFSDISGAAIQLGDYDTAGIVDAELQIRNNNIEDNFITNVAAEFRGACGIQVGYSAYTTIKHNTLSDLPYSGISIGWGWGTSDPSYAEFNVVAGNEVSDFKLVLEDGGGIYALSAQPGSVISRNWLYNMGKGAGGGAYYPDEGSAYWKVEENVFSNSSFCSDDCEWLHVWINSIHDIEVKDNYVDTGTMVNNGVDVDVVGTVLVEDGDWPDEAVKIMDEAGVRG